MNFRMNKDCFRDILTDLKQHMKRMHYVSSISPEVKFAAFLRFLACGSYQKSVSNSCISVMSQATFSRILTECLQIFEDYACAKWISLETTTEQELATKAHFYSRYKIPGVIGCVDGTHVKIRLPGSRDKHLFYNRKGFYSINAMIICDQNMVIKSVDATHPGANHDSYVWNISAANNYFNSLHISGKRNTWLIGDSGYPLQPYLLTPYRSPTQRHETLFNENHCKARNVVERCFGVLKNRFRCIIGERGLHYSPEKCTQIINACCALHNMCIFYKNEWPYQQLQVVSFHETAGHFAPPEAALSTRDRIARSML